MDQIILEKKRGRAEDFKTKIIIKCTHLITVLCHMSSPLTLKGIMLRINRILSDTMRTLDLAFVLVSALDCPEIRQIVHKDSGI